jgi:hypothetical protein
MQLRSLDPEKVTRWGKYLALHDYVGWCVVSRIPEEVGGPRPAMFVHSDGTGVGSVKSILELYYLPRQ